VGPRRLCFKPRVVERRAAEFPNNQWIDDARGSCSSISRNGWGS